MTYRDAVSRLYSLEFAGIRLGLDNITRLCRHLGDPQQDFVSIHVAGTNGKGSVCALLDAILRAAGYRVGRFTSPHLRDFRERIHLSGRPISRRRVTSFIEAHWPHIRRGDYSFFETTTALAFDTFARAKVDVAVVEVGLGGRLDATSILPSSLTIITRIALDHERLLGRTPRRIAREKAGIIRPGVPLIVGPLLREARDVIGAIAEKRSAPLWEADEILDDRAGGGVLPPVSGRWGMALPGIHQQSNCAIALAAVALLSTLGYAIPATAIRRGLGAVHWPARFQIIRGHPTVVYDAAHNLDSVRTVADTWKTIFPLRQAVVLFTARADKDYAAMAAALAPVMSHWVGCPLPTVDGIEREEMERIAVSLNRPFNWEDSPRWAWRTALRLSGPAGIVLVVGSHFLVGAVIPAGLVDRPANQTALWTVGREDLLAAARDPGRPF
ncbi:MAG TPA: folylpolyglutamate synthase/dihydrofolate synthase family protein [Acidobacteriota bacterium]|nr:folylpolyglutamate synthase/dihydrofolate synthase family protein [Acidobacteriota bacterium]